MIKFLGRALVLGFLLATPAVAAPTYNWTGFYVGVNGGLGYATGEFSDSCYYCATDAFDGGFAVLGATGGYNWQSGAAVFGVEGDIDWTNFDNDGVLGGDDNSFLRESIELDWLASLRARAGIAVDNTLLFVTAGPAFGHVDAPGIEYCCDVFDATATPTGTTFSSSGTRVGMIGGIGLEMAIQGNWTARADYLYFDLGAETADIDPPSDCSTDRACTVQNQLKGQVVRIAFNYHFVP